jgi:1,4-dihydroxy-2-naphthoate polyprenyltransferase
LGGTKIGNKFTRQDWLRVWQFPPQNGYNVEVVLKFITHWLRLSRLPFHSVGVLPFCLGTLMAWKQGFFRPEVFVVGTLAVVLIMLSTYHAGEYFDQHEDALSKKVFESRFAGGSGVIPEGSLSLRVPLWTSLISFLLAGLLGLLLQFYYRTGPYTLLLGAAGALPGFFYSTRPVRLVERGVGELFIGFCYGWLPVAVSFYIQAGFIDPLIHWISIPIALTIVNVVLLNEFHDYDADVATGKRNLLARLGKTRGAVVYVMLSVLSWAGMILNLYAGTPIRSLWLFFPVLFLSAWLSSEVLKRKYESRAFLELMCGFNIVVHLGTTSAFLLAFA